MSTKNGANGGTKNGANGLDPDVKNAAERLRRALDRVDAAIRALRRDRGITTPMPLPAVNARA